jgi:hypothetical protein
MSMVFIGPSDLLNRGAVCFPANRPTLPTWIASPGAAAGKRAAAGFSTTGRSIIAVIF